MSPNFKDIIKIDAVGGKKKMIFLFRVYNASRNTIPICRFYVTQRRLVIYIPDVRRGLMAALFCLA